MSKKLFWWFTGLAAAGVAVANRRRREAQVQAWRASLGPVERRTALVTGASSGIGSVYALALASQGYDLILVARREPRLRQMAAELSRRQGVQVEILTADLSVEAGIAAVEQAIIQHGQIECLVNNAGSDLPGRFAELPLEQSLALINLLEIACIRLARAALPGMLARHRGAIVNLASTAGYVPLPRAAIYSATKAALIRFSEALASELAGTGVRVQALCPGFTRTEFHAGPEFSAVNFTQTIPNWMWMQPEDVVSASLHGLAENRVVVIPGWINRVTVLGAQLGLVGPILGILRSYFPAPGSGPLGS